MVEIMPGIKLVKGDAASATCGVGLTVNIAAFEFTTVAHGVVLVPSQRYLYPFQLAGMLFKVRVLVVAPE
jgi:hypothetical protein